MLQYVLMLINQSIYPVCVPGLRMDPLRLLAGCRKRHLNQALRTGVKQGTFGRGAPRGNSSARTQLFAADRQTSHGSKKEETLGAQSKCLRKQKEAPYSS